jgi:hypothetical protein
MKTQTLIALLMLFCLALLPTSSARGNDLQRDAAVLISKDGYVKDHVTATFIDGPVYFSNPATPGWKPMTKGQLLVDGDSLLTRNQGWLVLTFSTDNLLLIKPKSKLTLTFPQSGTHRVQVRLAAATVMLSVRDGRGIQVVGRTGSLTLERGDAVVQVTETQEQVKSLLGIASWQPLGAPAPQALPEGRSLELDLRGMASRPLPFDTRMEYETFRRFSVYLKNFDQVNRTVSVEPAYRVDEVLIGKQQVSHMSVNEHGYRRIDPGAGPTPQQVHIRLKITPYPKPDDHFEIYLDKGLTYALREGRDGFFEVNIPTPSFPEFLLKVHFLNSLGQRDRIFEERFAFVNKRQKTQEVKEFLKEFTSAFARRDFVYLRQHISPDYRDWFGNSWFDFTKLLEDTLRTYRDIRLVLRPHTFLFKDNQVQVNVNYRLSALAGAWNYRYEDYGVDLITLVWEKDRWCIVSKTRGMLLQRIKMVVDPKRGVLKGKVLDEASGQPLAGATVRVLKTGFRGMSDRFGEYVLYNIPPGTYDVEISKNGYGKTTAFNIEILPYTERF